MTSTPARPVFDNGLSAVPVRELSANGDFLPSAPYEMFGLAPCSPTIGAEISGVDLAQPLSPSLHAELHRALLEWKVLFFRDQQLTAHQHRDLARHWGMPEVHPFLPKADGVAEVVRLSRGADSPAVENVWHSDASFETTPPMGSILRAVHVPEVGGDTLWSDMGAAYDGLTDAMQDRLDGLLAVHDFTQTFGSALGPEELARKQQQFPAVAHPVVRTRTEAGPADLRQPDLHPPHRGAAGAGEPRAAGVPVRPGPPARVTRCDCAGVRARSRSGTTARRSITPARTTTRTLGSWSV